MPATWKKVIVSGSIAELSSVNIDTTLRVSGSIGVSAAAGGTIVNQIGSTRATTFLTGSFSGSHYGDFTGSFSGSHFGQFTGSFTGSHFGTANLQGQFTGSFSGSANLNGQFTGSFSGSIASMPPLTQGVGIVPFTYSGSSAQTVAIQGAASLTTNLLPKWNGTGFSNSNITDTGTQVQIGSGATTGVTIAAGGINVTGNSTFNQNLIVTGDLTVAGTASFQNTENVLIADKFLILASGSNSLTDGGFIIASSTAPGGASGSAFFIEAASAGVYGRFAVAYNVHASSSTVAADEYMVTSKINAGNPSNATPPTWGSTTNGLGNMWVNSTTSDIFIWA
jgi:hypothetical protein